MDCLSSNKSNYTSPLSPTHVDVPRNAESQSDEIQIIPCFSLDDSDDVLPSNVSQNIISQVQNNWTGKDSIPQPVTIIDISNDIPDVFVENKKPVFVPETPAVEISFMNTDIGRKYRHEIEKFFHTLMTTENLLKKQEPLPTIHTRPNLPNDTAEPISPDTVIGKIQVFRWFMLDRLGWPMIANMLNQTPGVDIPQYEQQYVTDPYPPPEDAEIVEIKPIKTSKKCFNCGGNDHEAKACPKPFDKKAFLMNRAKYRAAGVQYGRYHKDDDSNKPKPGQISDALRKALGLLPNELPRHIYKMRELGYPPGWLLEAEATNSGLAMFDKYGREVDLDGDLMEDGQVPEHRMRDETNLRYNADKLIAYPGFNIPCGDNFKDEAYSDKRFKKMDSSHSLESMSSKLVTEDSTSRKRPQTYSVDDEVKRRKVDHLDMDLSDGEHDDSPSVIEITDEYHVIDELPAEPDDSPEPASSSQNTNIYETLNALEEERKKLLAELNAIEGSSVEGTYVNTPTSEINGKDSANESSSNIGDDRYQAHQSLCYQVSTPIVKHTPYDRLPSAEMFASGITEHLPYENLPNATGSYEKMSELMKSVREKLTVKKSRRKM